MKKLFLILAIILFSVCTYAVHDASSVIEAWELEGNTTGAQGLYDLTWTGTPSYSSVIYKIGSYSAGFPEAA